MENLVSVIVTCYNHEKYIKDCLSSIFDQSYRNIELFIYNDGSTDNSEQVILKEIELSPYPTEYIVHDNQGVVLTRNEALTNINGDFLIFVDSDDIIEQDFIKEQVLVAINQKADLVYTSLRNLDTKEVIVKAKEFSLEDLFAGNYIHASALIRKSILGDNQFDVNLNRYSLEDYDFFLKLVTKHNIKAAPCYSVSLDYRVGEFSRSNHKDFSAYYRSYTYILKKYIVEFPEYTSRAYEKSIELLTKFDIEHSIKQEKLSIYLSETGEFGEESDFQFPILFEDHIEIPVTSKVKKIRIKPSNIPSFYESFSLITKTDQTEIMPVLTTGIIDDKSLIFEDFYPFIDYDIYLNQDDVLRIQYKRYNINDIVSKDYIGKLLARQKYDKEQKITILEEDVSFLQQQLEEVRDETVQLLTQYNSVVNSRRWTIPTKILNFFRRRK